MHNTEILYDKIGKTYDKTRKADPEITLKLISHLMPEPEGLYLDIGCGSGNYTRAIFELGYKIYGLDISEEMLVRAHTKHPYIEWFKGDAKKMPFPDQLFNGALCVFATHHIKDIQPALKEIHRVLKHGRLVILTSLPEQMKKWWLCHYFPSIMERAINNLVDDQQFTKMLNEAGFTTPVLDPFFVTNELQDWFPHSGKYRPEIYLNPEVRAGMSIFSYEDKQVEVALGCEMLQRDINSGEIQRIIESYESDVGDFTFLVSEKK